MKPIVGRPVGRGVVEPARGADFVGVRSVDGRAIGTGEATSGAGVGLAPRGRGECVDDDAGLGGARLGRGPVAAATTFLGVRAGAFAADGDGPPDPDRGDGSGAVLRGEGVAGLGTGFVAENAKGPFFVYSWPAPLSASVCTRAYST